MARLRAELQRRAQFCRDDSVWTGGTNAWPLSLRVLKLLVLATRGRSGATLTSEELDTLRRLADGDLSALDLVGNAGTSVTPQRAREWLGLAESTSRRAP
jgi:hypothetical protein